MIVIDERRLTPVARLGDGDDQTDTHVTCTDARLPADLVFRAIRRDLDPADGQRLVDQMRKVVGLRATMPPDDLTELDDLTVWPLAVVARDDRFLGCLTRMVDPDFFLETRRPDGRPARRLFDMRLLPVPADRLQALGVERLPVDDDLVRLALMARLAYAIEVIHRPRGGQRLVYGDLSLAKVAVATKPPRVLLMDCDGVADVSDPDRLQPHTPFFVPPEMQDRQQNRQDQATDVFKLALCVVRGLATGPGAAQLIDPASPLVRRGLLNLAGTELLNDALSPDRRRRPTAEEIKDYLIGRVLDLAERPRARTR